MEWVEFTILGHVPAKSSKQRVGISKSGRPYMYTAGAVKQYAEDFAKQINRTHKIYGEWDGGLNVQFVVYAPHRKQDLDSYSKILLDLMQECGIIKNDNRIEELYLRRYIDAENPRVEVRLWKGGEIYGEGQEEGR